jgi:hypothetical protein
VKQTIKTLPFMQFFLLQNVATMKTIFRNASHLDAANGIKSISLHESLSRQVPTAP